MDTRPHNPPKLGRPRSDTARAAILAAAMKMLKSQPLDQVTIKAIAALAGVGRQTVYRWWPRRGDIILEAVQEIGRTEIPLPETGSFNEDLTQFLSETFQWADKLSDALVLLIVDAQSDREFAAKLRTEFIDRRRAVLAAMIERGKRDGQVSPSTDTELVLDLVYGPLWYRLLNRHAPLDRSFAAQLSCFIGDALGTNVSD